MLLRNSDKLDVRMGSYSGGNFLGDDLQVLDPSWGLGIESGHEIYSELAGATITSRVC